VKKLNFDINGFSINFSYSEAFNAKKMVVDHFGVWMKDNNSESVELNLRLMEMNNDIIKEYESMVYSQIVEDYFKKTNNLIWRLSFEKKIVDNSFSMLKLNERNVIMKIDIDSKSIDIYCDVNEFFEGAHVANEIITETIKIMYVHFMEARGFIVVHASCVDIDGKGVLYVGDSGAGKTTTLINTLDMNNAKCVSNDSVFIKQEKGKIIAIGVPHTFNIRPNSVHLYKDLKIHETITTLIKNIKVSVEKIVFNHVDIIKDNINKTFVDEILFLECDYDSDNTVLIEIDKNLAKDIFTSNVKSYNNPKMMNFHEFFVRDQSYNTEYIDNTIDSVFTLSQQHKMCWAKDIREFIGQRYKEA